MVRNIIFVFQMKNSIPRYTFYKNKYGSELLVDVVELKYVKKFLAESAIHTLNYYDVTFITEGKGTFSVDNQTYEVTPCDVLFSKPGEIRNWDTRHIINGYALIFEEEFLSSLFKDSLFVQHLSFFQLESFSSRLHLPDELYARILQILHHIKMEIDSYQQNGVHVLRALLYEVLMLLENGLVQTYFPSSRGIKTAQYTLALYIDRDTKQLKKSLLFDDVKDPYQLHNLPLEENKKIVAQLCGEMGAMLKEINDPWYTEKILSDRIPY